MSYSEMISDSAFHSFSSCIHHVVCLSTGFFLSGNESVRKRGEIQI